MMMPFIFTCDLDLSRARPFCKITFWAISQLLMNKMLSNFNTRQLGSVHSNKSQKYSELFEHATYTFTHYNVYHYAKRRLGS